MKQRYLGVAAVLAMLMAVAASPAAATVACAPIDTCIGSPCPILLQFDANAFAHETNYNKTTFISQPGSQLTVVGLITQFGPALPFLNANDPNKEYTFIFKDLVSAGTITSLNGPTTLKDTDYDSLKTGTFEIYEGTPRNSPDTPAEWALPANAFGAAVPGLHTDGTLILSGDLCGFHTNVAQTGSIVSGSFRAQYRPTGGTLYPFIQGTDGLLGGLWCANLAGCKPSNYTAHPNGKFDATGATTPVTRATWGKLKQIYR